MSNSNKEKDMEIKKGYVPEEAPREPGEGRKEEYGYVPEEPPKEPPEEPAKE